MQTSCRTTTLRTRCSVLLLFALATVAALAPAAAAQTLARPGWAGSGLAAEAWWHSAVFYRIDVAHFQDSDGNGIGDLRGVAQRLDYVQSLGVDAVVLLAPVDEAGFDDLLREGSGRHIRLIVALPASADSGRTIAAARQWLTRGAAGIYLQRDPAATSQPDTTALLHSLRALVDGFPGQRIVLSEIVPGISLRAHSPHTRTAELVDAQIVSGADVLQRERNDPQGSSESAELLLTDARFRSANAFFAQDAAQQLGMNKILATVLLSFRGAVSLRYGQELGLAAEAGGDQPRTMQWTPANITLPVTVDAPPPPRPKPDVYGAYVPYVPPKKIVGKPVPDLIADANSLRGYTSGSLAEAPGKTNRASANVALEDANPNSLLNFYRRLVQLHHGNSSIRNGAPVVLDPEAESALVWVRRAPTGARTAANVVVACNMGELPLTLSLDRDLQRLHIAPGTLRPLLASWTESPIAQGTERIILPPYSVFVGELFHAGR